MYEILKKRELTLDTKLFEVSAPLIANKAKPGQFIIFRLDEDGERVPLTIAKADKEKGTITIVFQEVGKSTKQLGTLNEGDKILNLVGPLGKPAEIEKIGTVVCIGGGVGIACVFPEIGAMKEAGNEVISIIGARNESLLLFEEEIDEISDEFYITTDDGSKGHHGFVSDILKNLIDEQRKIDLVIAVGPIIMMKVVADVTRPYGIKTVVSLNPIMVDGTGMCGSCRVEVGGETRFACVDGPEFDGHMVDFDMLMTRNSRYLDEEKISLCKCQGGE
ncbi:MAG: sulfide/dihydroorotate dehydrogenase-like FAD/NAD-binding protein [Halobacteriota archaeon]|nr:sulfide/dihydroorotate dehydrogenase-like FAD/NAD-binding protein [Halobacteriota archaeon]